MDPVEPFCSAVLAARNATREKKPAWWRYTNAMRESSGLCVYCGAQLRLPDDRAADQSLPKVLVNSLVPAFHGGPQLPANLVSSCASCAHAKGSSDWLQWGKATSSVTALQLEQRRLTVLERCPNHLVRDGSRAKTKPTVMKFLSDRWAHPRFVVWAAMTDAGGLVSWCGPDEVPLEVTAVMLHFKAKLVPTSVPVWSFPSFPDPAFLSAIWQLIDINAWVRRIQLTDFPDPTPADDADSRWWETYTDVGDVHRRRARLPGNWKAKPKVRWGHDHGEA
jgi:hypothetical protein